MINFYFKTERSNIIVLILTILLNASFVILNTDLNGAYIMLWITLFILFFVFLKGGIRCLLEFKRYHKQVFIFGVYCLINSFWAIDPIAAIENGITIIEILLCMSVLYAYYNEGDNIDNLLLTLVWSGIVISVYSLIFYSYDNMVAIASMGDRIDTEFANVNSIAMAGSTAFVISLYFLFFKRLWLPFLASLTSIPVIAASGSRKAFVMIILGIFVLLMSKFSTKKRMKMIVKMSFLSVILIIALNLEQDSSLFYTVNNRMEGLIAMVTGKGEVDSSAKKRELYIEEGIEQWVENPILGLGMANSYIFNSNKTYTHNNYVELLSCGGLIGFIVYYSMFIYLIFNIWKYRYRDEKRAVLFGLIIGMSLIMDYGQVSYYSKGTYFQLMILFLYVKVLKENHKNKIIA